jgi:SET domain-containing protein
MAWYLNEPNEGARPNVRFGEESSDFFALRDIKLGEELTVDYSTYSDRPPSALA